MWPKQCYLVCAIWKCLTLQKCSAVADACEPYALAVTLESLPLIVWWIYSCLISTAMIHSCLLQWLHRGRPVYGNILRESRESVWEVSYGYFKHQHNPVTQEKWQRLLSPACSPVVQKQGSGCVKNGQCVCLAWQTTPPTPPHPPTPLLPNSCHLPKWTQCCEKREYWCGKSQFLFGFFPVLLSYFCFHCFFLPLLHLFNLSCRFYFVFLLLFSCFFIFHSIPPPWSSMNRVLHPSICISLCACRHTYVSFWLLS